MCAMVEEHEPTTSRIRPFLFIDGSEKVVSVQVSNASEFCFWCNVSTIGDTKTASMVCPECGEQTRHGDRAGGYRISKTFSYKRENHLLEHIRRVQGLNNSKLDPDMYSQVCEYVQDHNVDLSCIFVSDVRQILKDLGLCKHYVQSMKIWSSLTNKNPPAMTVDQESVLLSLFNQVQNVWDEVNQGRRSNMLSYNLILSNLCTVAGYEDLKPFFPLLKSRTKMIAQHKFWIEICRRLGWPSDTVFIPHN